MGNQFSMSKVTGMDVCGCCEVRTNGNPPNTYLAEKVAPSSHINFTQRAPISPPTHGELPTGQNRNSVGHFPNHGFNHTSDEHRVNHTSNEHHHHHQQQQHRHSQDSGRRNSQHMHEDRRNSQASLQGRRNSQVSPSGRRYSSFAQQGTEHPYLNDYFRAIERNLFRMRKEEAHGERSPLIKEIRKLALEAFRAHDNDANHVLDPTESQVFFSHYVENLIQFCHRVEQTGNNQGQWHQNVGGQNTSMQGLNRPIIQDQEVEYRKVAKSRNHAAFSIIDKDKDGRLHEDELVNALTPGHNLNVKMHQALGLDMKYY